MVKTDPTQVTNIEADNILGKINMQIVSNKFFSPFNQLHIKTRKDFLLDMYFTNVK